MPPAPPSNKRFGFKAAFAVFGFVVVANVALLTLDRRFPDSRGIIIPAWMVNAPGLPVVLMCPVPMGESETGPWDYLAVVSAGLFSALFWAGLAGLIFRRRTRGGVVPLSCDPPAGCSYQDRLTYYSLADLESVKNSINKAEFPERYQFVLQEIAKRTIGQE